MPLKGLQRSKLIAGRQAGETLHRGFGQHIISAEYIFKDSSKNQ